MDAAGTERPEWKSIVQRVLPKTTMKAISSSTVLYFYGHYLEIWAPINSYQLIYLFKVWLKQQRKQIEEKKVSRYVSYSQFKTMLLKIPMHWAGHIVKREEHYLLKITLSGSWSIASIPELCQKSDTKTPLKRPSPPVKSTTNKDQLRLPTKNFGSKSSPKSRMAMEEKRQCYKNHTAEIEPTCQTSSSSWCKKSCLSEIVFISHQRACICQRIP